MWSTGPENWSCALDTGAGSATIALVAAHVKALDFIFSSKQRLQN